MMGGMVDEVVYLFIVLERMCEVQLMVEVVGLEKKIVSDEVVVYIYKVNVDFVSDIECYIFVEELEVDIIQEMLYMEFQLDFEYEIWKFKGELSKGEL